jgi:pSer/pThr/pTyr-binding forkhead associated (FHA) protein
MNKRPTFVCATTLLALLWGAPFAIAQVKTPERIPIRTILAGLRTDQLVYVEGVTGDMFVERPGLNTRLYWLHDLHGDRIRVRTSNLDFQKGRSHGVRGTVIRRDREFILVEDVRAIIGGITERGMRAQFLANIGEGPQPAAQPEEAKAAPKAGAEAKGAEEPREEEALWQNPLVIGGAAALVVAIIVGSVITASGRKRQEELRRRRERELEEERLRREREREALQRRYTEPAPPILDSPGRIGVAAAPAKGPREDTLLSWGTVKVESGPGQLVKGGFLVGPVTVIGREEGQVVIHGDPLISGKADGHGKILLATDGTTTYVDNSTNGSKVNGRPVHHGQIALQSGDLIELGQTALRFENSRQADAADGSRSAARAPTEAFAAPSNLATGIHTSAKVKLISGPGAGKEYSLLQAKTTVGRASGQDIELDDTTASREHCEIHVRDGKLFLRNLSQNGTTVGNSILRERGSEAEINDGDELQMGSTRMKLMASS